MLTLNEARVIGKNACIEKIGKEFYEKYKETSTTAYGDFIEDGVVFCYVGVDDRPINMDSPEVLVLSNKEWKNPIRYSASCNVSLYDGKITFLECVLPA